MNKSKLLITSALVGVVGFAGVASAKIGGSIGHTYTFSSDNENGSVDASGDRIGTEFNLTMSGKADLDNGMFAAYSGKWEYDGNGSSHPDHEYEMQYGMGDLYVGLANDGGNKIAGFAGNYVSYAPQSLANAVTNVALAQSSDGFDSDVEGKDNISFNAKAMGGLFTVRYTPNTSADHGNDIANPDASASTSGTAIIYKGSPMDGLTVKVATQTVEDGSSGGNKERKTTHLGASYNFGQYTLGIDRKDYEAGAISSTSDKKTTMLTGTYAVNDATTLGLTYHEVEAGGDNSSSPDEEVTSLTVGYNLGGATFAVNLVQAENIGNSTGVDAEGIVFTSAFKF
jgi:hypothetical protein